LRRSDNHIVVVSPSRLTLRQSDVVEVGSAYTFGLFQIPLFLSLFA